MASSIDQNIAISQTLLLFLKYYILYSRLSVTFSLLINQFQGIHREFCLFQRKDYQNTICWVISPSTKCWYSCELIISIF